MPIFNDYAENGELLQTRDEPLNAENFDRYVKENGIEKAQGYLKALSDMTKQIDQCYIKRTYPADITGLNTYTLIPNSEVVFQRKILLVKEQKESFLNFARSSLASKKRDDPNPQDLYPKTNFPEL